jgi:RND family efflux transporter MFP subunit
MTTHEQIIALVLASAACHKAAALPPSPPAVQVADVVQRDVPIYRTWVANLNGFVNIDVRPQVEGYVHNQMYKEGRYVTEGELLFLIDPGNHKALADQAKSALDRDAAALAKARLNVERDGQLIANAVISRQEFDNDLAREQQAAAAVVSDRATLARVRLNRDWTQVTSPIAGIVGVAQAQVGTLVSPPTTMTTVSQVDPIKVQFNITESEYLRSVEGNHWVEPGRSAKPALELILDDGSVSPQRGTVIVTNRQVDQQTGTIAIQGLFPNPGNVLRPGQHAKVRAAVETRKGALVVPQRAVNELQGAHRVGVVAADGKVDVRTVRAGEQVGNMRIIDDGLRPGEKIIVEGFARVRPGMFVRASLGPSGPTASVTAPPSAAPSPGR